MRARTLLPAAACLAAGLGGCTVVDTSNTPEDEARLKVAHAGGETIVPAKAKRIVALEPDAAESARALGVSVVGGSHPSLDTTKAVNPDLILGSKRNQGKIYDQLEDIAPTVLEERPGVDWKLNLRLHGESFNRPDAGERLLLDYDQRVARVRRRLGPRGRSRVVSLIRVTPQGVEAYDLGAFSGTILGDAGLRRPRVESGRRGMVFVPAGRISSVDGDVLLVAVAPGGEAKLRRLEASPAWARLKAVRSGHVERVSDRTWITGQGILSARRALRDLARVPAP